MYHKILKQTTPLQSGSPWWYSELVTGGVLPNSAKFTIREGNIYPRFIVCHVRSELTGGDGTSDLLLRCMMVNSRAPSLDVGCLHHIPPSDNALALSWDNTPILKIGFGPAYVILNAAGSVFEKTMIFGVFTMAGAMPIPCDQVYLKWEITGTAYGSSMMRAYLEVVA